MECLNSPEGEDRESLEQLLDKVIDIGATEESASGCGLSIFCCGQLN